MTADILQVILETARRMFRDLVTPEAVTDAMRGVWPKALWDELENVGLTTLEEDGLAFSDALAVLQVAGYYAVPGPLAESFLVSKFLTDAGLAVPAERVSLGITLPEEVQATETRSVLDVTGVCTNVPWGRQADALVLVIPAGDKTFVGVYGKDEVKVTTHSNLAGEPSDVVGLQNASTSNYGILPYSYDHAIALAALTRVMLAAGAFERMLELTVQYVKERSQFGRPLAKFQAIQQKIAEIASQAAEVRAIANRAMDSLQSGADLIKYVALAKVLLAQAGPIATAHAHQAHGAMGFTEEYALHHFTRRIWMYRHEYGNELYWSKSLDSQLSGTDLWTFITG